MATDWKPDEVWVDGSPDRRLYQRMLVVLETMHHQGDVTDSESAELRDLVTEIWDFIAKVIPLSGDQTTEEEPQMVVDALKSAQGEDLKKKLTSAATSRLINKMNIDAEGMGTQDGTVWLNR
jgi:hypothetical protein